VPLHKVNWDAKQDYEFINNYKVLQNCFSKLKIDKVIPSPTRIRGGSNLKMNHTSFVAGMQNIEVEKLIRAKYQDNLEFMQWFKRFYELNRPPTDYDAVAERLARGGSNAPGSLCGCASGRYRNRSSLIS
jgi:RP/EB family microtubule-associated protein